MRYLVLVLSLCCTLVAAQELPAKYLSEDGQVAVFLQELEGVLDASIMLGYGLLFPLEVQLEGNNLAGSLGEAITVAGVLEGETLRLTLKQAGEQQAWSLTRQLGRAEANERSVLLKLLALVPDTAIARRGAPSVSFADFQAALTIDGLTGPQTRAAFAAMPEEARRRWIAALQRLQSGPPELLQYAFVMIEALPELLGFEWFAIEQALGYGTPPYTGTLLAVEVEPAQLNQRLSGRDFEEEIDEGVTVWYRQEDAQSDLGRREPADPFVGALGMAARIAVLPNILANSRFWIMTRTVVRTFRGHYPSLAESPDYRTLSEAISLGDNVLVQAQFFAPLEVGFLPDDPSSILASEPMVAAREGEVLAPYGLAVLADRQEGQDQVSLIALLYEDADTAEQASAVLAERLTNFRPDLLAEWSAGLDEPQVYASDSGLFVAIASVRYPLPAPGAEGTLRPGGVFAAWLQALFRREFTPLEIGPSR